MNKMMLIEFIDTYTLRYNGTARIYKMLGKNLQTLSSSKWITVKDVCFRYVLTRPQMYVERGSSDMQPMLTLSEFRH